MSEILFNRGFELRKWKSNNLDVLGNLNVDEKENTVEFVANKDDGDNILGLS